MTLKSIQDKICCKHPIYRTITEDLDNMDPVDHGTSGSGSGSSTNTSLPGRPSPTNQSITAHEGDRPLEGHIEIYYREVVSTSKRILVFLPVCNEIATITTIRTTNPRGETDKLLMRASIRELLQEHPECGPPTHTDKADILNQLVAFEMAEHGMLDEADALLQGEIGEKYRMCAQCETINLVTCKKGDLDSVHTCHACTHMRHLRSGRSTGRSPFQTTTDNAIYVAYEATSSEATKSGPSNPFVQYAHIRRPFSNSGYVNQPPDSPDRPADKANQKFRGSAFPSKGNNGNDSADPAAQGVKRPRVTFADDSSDGDQEVRLSSPFPSSSPLQSSPQISLLPSCPFVPSLNILTDHLQTTRENKRKRLHSPPPFPSSSPSHSSSAQSPQTDTALRISDLEHRLKVTRERLAGSMKANESLVSAAQEARAALERKNNENKRLIEQLVKAKARNNVRERIWNMRSNGGLGREGEEEEEDEEDVGQDSDGHHEDGDESGSEMMDYEGDDNDPDDDEEMEQGIGAEEEE